MSKRHGNMAKNETPETEIETSDGGDAPLIDQHEAAIKKLKQRRSVTVLANRRSVAKCITITKLDLRHLYF